MLKNYFKIAWRNINRNKAYAFINITGLAIGVAACLLIFLVIQFETSFDKFHANRQRIYRVGSKFKLPDGIHYSPGTCFPAAKQLRLDYPQFENVSTIYASAGDQITVLDDNSKTTQKKFDEEGLFFIEPHFFEMFDFPFLAGDAKTALAEPYTAVVTQATAERYFGDWKKAMGRSIKYKDHKICKITGILKNLPVNTDFPIQVALSLKTNNNESSDDWGSNDGYLNTFVTVPPSMTYEQLNKNLVDFTKKHETAEYAARRIFFAQPLTEMHFDSRFGTYNHRTFSKVLITSLSLIGLFLMIIACINFINMATAQAVNRAKEVGVRKVLGSLKKQLVSQFLSETFIITLFSVIIAVLIAYSTLPFLNQLLKTGITVEFNAAIMLFIAGVLIVVTLLSGLYPAVILAGFNPIAALKSKLTTKTVGGISLRRVLVVLQFTVAQALIVGTLIVVGQMNYFKTAPMGFDRDAIVNINIPGDSLSMTKREALKTQLLRNSSIKNVSYGAFAITDDSHWGSNFTFDNTAKPVDFNADLKWSDAEVFKTYDLQMVAGSPYRPSDTVREFVVNESLVKQLGIRNPQDIIGKKINFWGGTLVGPVVGVVKDFNASSMKDAMYPVVMAPWKYVYGTMAVKIQPEHLQQTLAFIEKNWNAAYPEYVYKFQFLDDKIASFYEQENQLSQLYKIFAGIAIFISCLGLYGLVSFMAVQRTKEIGIRKVLGASAGNIIFLFSKEFMLLIGVAFAIAAPLAYYFMHNWLNNFSFRISIGAGVFVITITSSIVIAWLTVSYQAIKASIANPVESLRTE
ncbi:MAG TPA: ABC transporter permease [Puia sp.]|jgi:putative ABC transport system permease protein|nr:ABC transporter permease [Puia sp.]